MVKPGGPQITSQYGAYALHAGQAGLQACTRMHTPTRSGTRAHTHTHKYVIFIGFPRHNNNPRASMFVIRTLPVLLNHKVIMVDGFGFWHKVCENCR
jgi:hypothetical protein